MAEFRRRLPGMSALIYFEAAARHLSFSRAAEDMNVTQGAISRQVRLLEERLGFPLFHRLHKAIELTESGRRFLPVVTSSLDSLDDGIEGARLENAHQHITIAATTAMSHSLIARLPTLYENFPDLDVQILASNLHLENIPNQFDIGIAFGLGIWPGFKTNLLARGEVFPVCSPAYLERMGGSAEPSQLIEHPLLHCDDNQRFSMDWPFWFKSAGIYERTAPPKLRVSNNTLLMKAAAEGQGIALCWSNLVDDHLTSGRLVRACDHSVTTKQGFYAITKADELQKANIQHVLDWLMREFAKQSE